MTAPNEPDVHNLLRAHCFTRDLAEAHVDRVVAHAHVETLPAGTRLFREGQPADDLYLLVEGRVAIEMHVPGRGAQVVDTVEACETVGWSWLVAPYRWFFDARAVTDVTVVRVDAEALRDLADDDPSFGYALMRQVAAVMLERMQSARARLADVYGTAAP